MKRTIMVLSVMMALLMCGCAQNTDDKQPADDIKTSDMDISNYNDIETTDLQEPVEIEGEIYGLGKEVDIKIDNKRVGTIKINSVKSIDYSNSFSDKRPEQIVVVEYTYKNINRKDGMFISSSHLDVIDDKRFLASTYPAEIDMYPQDINKGDECSAVQAYGLQNKSESVNIGFKSSIQDTHYDFFFEADVENTVENEK